MCLLTSRIALPQAYVELNELQGNIWQETGRWVGYEENFNPATGKWGPSHVSHLTFKSLIQLRKTMSTGAFGDPDETESYSYKNILYSCFQLLMNIKRSPNVLRCRHLRPECQQSIYHS